MYSTNPHSNAMDSQEHIAQNTCYALVVDKAKNRIYFTIHGYWKNKEAVPAFLDDWKRSVALTQSGFTILTDMSTMITHPQELAELHLIAQKMVIDAGVRNVANVLPSDKIANLQANSFTTNSSLPYRNFSSIEEAETWLNQLSAPSLN
ncbi:hypothetical protein H8S95_10850 [Pontibacter sp. KCTC 32443]|uniref:hypothetical protein n=1 Tax=Pontibacter TaxID=323449 RepID=UPI00164CE5CD|nr:MULTISPECIES: hypothetical protein [Pontibacter]MBC5774559.1 hypothetical protein [Pontibacter sp. KCTC 32443]